MYPRWLAMSNRHDERLAGARRRIVDQLGQDRWALPGSFVTRMMRCGKANCRCKHDPPQLHGPYLQWTRTVEGKTVTKLLTRQQAERYQAWIDSARQLRQLLTELENLSVLAVQHAEDWGP
ncbi:MAG: DUF6788 family protein [Actinomycetota bacterium]